MDEKVNNNIEEKVVLDDNAKDIMKRAEKGEIISKSEIKKKLEECRDSIEFLKKLEHIVVSDETNRVIFTDGEEQLIYINGEFYIASSTDDTIVKKKKTKQEAKNMYLEYFMKYQSGSIKVDEKPNIELQEKNIEKDMTIDEKRLEDSSQKEVVSSLDTKEIEIEIPSSDEKRSEKLRE